jgi:hypothetical protein
MELRGAEILFSRSEQNCGPLSRKQVGQDLELTLCLNFAAARFADEVIALHASTRDDMAAGLTGGVRDCAAVRSHPT